MPDSGLQRTACRAAAEARRYRPGRVIVPTADQAALLGVLEQCRHATRAAQRQAGD